MKRQAWRSCRVWQREMCCWFMKNAPCFLGLSNPSVLWARTGLFNWWALTLLASKDKPFMLVFLLLFPAPTEHLFLHHPCSNPKSFARDGVPTCSKAWQICWAESHPLKPIPSSVLAFPGLPSSLLQLHWVHSVPALLFTPTGLSITPGSTSCSRQSRIYRELESKEHFLCWRCLLICKYD